MDAMYEAFNMGVGFTVTVSADTADEVIKYVNENFKSAAPGVARRAARIGAIMKSEAGEKFRYAA
jgi:phosphoribosylaminoimidazole (AIR) synthetase